MVEFRCDKCGWYGGREATAHACPGYNVAHWLTYEQRCEGRGLTPTPQPERIGHYADPRQRFYQAVMCGEALKDVAQVAQLVGREHRVCPECMGEVARRAQPGFIDTAHEGT